MGCIQEGVLEQVFSRGCLREEGDRVPGAETRRYVGD